MFDTVLEMSCGEVRTAAPCVDRWTRARPSAPSRGEECDAQAWIGLICTRDEGAFRRLHAAFHGRVYRCALGIVRREEVAHEIVSISFMQVWTTAARYDPARGSVVAWLMLIARSRSLDAMRRARLERLHEVRFADDEDDPMFELPAESRCDPLLHVEQGQRDWRVRRALLRLTPIQRQVVSLTTMDGLSHEEASRHLDLPLGTIKSHARRGLAALRERCEATGLVPA